ncbi:MAG: putative lipoprotein [Myxococcaceae bacterium]|nr:putative lipoprotein [Myxococcaceae bacterium]
MAYLDLGWPRFFKLERALCIAALCVTTGCAGHAARTRDARRALDRHDPNTALSLYNKELEVGSSAELPKEVKGDNALLLMDRSTISQEVQQYQNSSRDLETADKQVEMLDFERSTAHEIGRYLFSDNTGPYKARPFEKLLINTVNMMNYLAEGNVNGAKVEARRLAVMQKYLSESQAKDPTAQLLGPGSYLAGFTFERNGDFDEAVRYYDEALKATPYSSLQAPLQRLAPYSSYSSPRIKALIGSGSAPPLDKEAVDLVVLVNYGRVPALKAVRMPIGLALTASSLYLAPEQTQAARRLEGQGLVTWVNYPELEPTGVSYGLPTVTVDGQPAALDTITLVDELVRAAYAKARGPIIASAVTRMITRAVAGTAAGVAAGKASGRGPIGMLVALATEATLMAVDTPDTRSWSTLPARMTLSRLRLPAGKHTVRVEAQGIMREQTIDIPKGGFAVVNLTELSQ